MSVAFDRASVIGARGVGRVLELLKERSFGGQCVTTTKGRYAPELQKALGDILFNHKDDPDRLVSVEIKTEQRFTGNLFLEHWSNLSRLTPGWMVTLRADLLFYAFEDRGRVFILDLPKLQQWAFREATSRADFPGWIYAFPLRRQGRYQQMNDTWGRLVPLRVLRESVGLWEWDMKAESWVEP
jgi:hypothetical protein